MSVCAYSALKQQILVSVSANDRLGETLCILKEFYKNDINSRRRLEQITTIGQLLHVLEIRDVISENDVGPLKEISQRLPNNSELLRKIDLYEATQIRRNYKNCHAPEVTQTCNGQHIEPPSNQQPINLCSIKKQKILDTIVDEIGISWRNLARNLKLSEPTIANIEDSCNSLSEKVIKVLEIYRIEDNPQTLCDALKKIRRKDLSVLLQEIIAGNT